MFFRAHRHNVPTGLSGVPAFASLLHFVPQPACAGPYNPLCIIQVKNLLKAIADHLESFRGMSVNPDQIIIGAGTEYLYGLLIKLLGNDKLYCIENPADRLRT